MERKQDQKFTAYISDFKNQIPQLLDGQKSQLDGQISQNQSRVLDLLAQIESKVDTRDAEVLRQASEEVEKSAAES